jgi:hypothetical protein
VRVLVVCEDPTHDRFIVKPVVERIFDDLGRRARVDILDDPHLTGIDSLLAELPAIVDDNKALDLITVVADRDGGGTRNEARLRNAVARSQSDRVLVCCAEEEVEVWMLALHRDAFPDWNAVPADRDVKDHYAIPFLREREFGGPGRGRRAAMRDLGKSWRGLLQLCPEIDVLKQQIRAFLERSAH